MCGVLVKGQTQCDFRNEGLKIQLAVALKGDREVSKIIEDNMIETGAMNLCT